MEPTRSLGDIANNIDSQVQTLTVLVGENLGYTTLKTSMTLRQFIDMSWVANKSNNSSHEAFKEEAIAQRNLIPAHVKGLAQYTLMGLVKSQVRIRNKQGKSVSEEIKKIASSLPNGPYASLQPVVCNIRNCQFGGTDLQVQPIKDRLDIDTGVYKVPLGQRQLLYVVDGQHRRAGFEQVLDFLKDVCRTYKYPKRGIFSPSNYNGEIISESENEFWQDVLDLALTRSTLAIEIHLGLNAEQEQQMFVDLNSKSKTVQVSFVNSFDHADPINKYINDVLISEKILPFQPSDEDQSDWHKDRGQLKRKDLKQINSLLLLGKTTSNTATPSIIEERSEFGRKFWNAVSNIKHFGKDGAKAKTISQQPVVLKALAKLSFDLGYGTPAIRNQQSLSKLFSEIKDGKLSFSHENEVWRSLFYNEEDRNKKFPGIEEYIYIPSQTNLDAGTWDEDNKWVRYGSRHNDIYPRLGDIIRFQLGLPPRPTVKKSIENDKNKKLAEELLKDFDLSSFE
ncbi:DNA sulfur modification protein DndB [Thalassospira sp. MCCC 1A01428]|uniref:DNA sulfur modification protein DndB n=1 Tax=Thalassospira sp. MCCC 1A01428 TaxID=1470575 RepID=UPI000A1DA622|nr:DNA sulfur modification protein DndB [Thalassospira sp. MCCC 1A01428]OSQ45380.1 hypothetical protein THS27_03210 [Thalassospira sp. MCCC 1A01428]